MDRETLIKRNAIHGLETAIEISSGIVRLSKEHAIAILGLIKEQQPKESRWVSIPYKKDRICKRCGHDEPYKYAEKETEIYLYCPHCGAKMEERIE